MIYYVTELRHKLDINILRSDYDRHISWQSVDPLTAIVLPSCPNLRHTFIFWWQWTCLYGFFSVFDHNFSDMVIAHHKLLPRSGHYGHFCVYLHVSLFRFCNESVVFGHFRSVLSFGQFQIHHAGTVINEKQIFRKFQLMITSISHSKVGPNHFYVMLNDSCKTLRNRFKNCVVLWSIFEPFFDKFRK